MAHEKREELALWRYHLVAEALNPRLSKLERGAIVRRIAGEEHTGPTGEPTRVGRNAIDRWIRAYRSHGLDGLKYRIRSDRGTARRRPDLIEEAARLREEDPARSAAHIAEIVHARFGVRLAERTLREHFQLRGLTRAELLRDQRTFGRYEAAEPNERWIADVLVGPFIPHPRSTGSRRARLFLIVDDHSRLLIHGRWCEFENLRAGQEILRAAIIRRGLPVQLYADNGSAYAGADLARTCAVLGIRLIHSRPGKPQGRGKLERLNRVIRERFLLEAEHRQRGIASFQELNDDFDAWVELYLNVRQHTETEESPAQRYAKLVHPRMVDADLLNQAFMWSVLRRVGRTATVSFEANAYQVDAALVGRRIELRYRPEDLSRIQVFFEGRDYGLAVPEVISRHVHPRAPQALRPPAEPTGIDYLAIVREAHEAGDRQPIPYRRVIQEETP